MLDKERLVSKAAWEGVDAGPGHEVVIESGWVQRTTRHAPTPVMNGVYRCEMGDDEADARVPATVRHYRELKLPFRWKIGPLTRPANLGARLVENGLELKEKLYGLIGDPARLEIAADPAVRVEALTELNLENWLGVQAKAWRVPPPGITHMRRAMGEALARREHSHLNFLAYLNDEPVGSAALRFFPDYAFLMGGAVNPEARGRGVYRALLAYRLRLIARRGLPAVIHCLEDTSAPICLRLGFEKVCEIHSYEPRA